MCVTNIQKTTPGVRESVEECLSGSVPPELSCEKALHLGDIEQSRTSGTMRRVRLTVRHFSANGISLYPGEVGKKIILCLLYMMMLRAVLFLSPSWPRCPLGRSHHAGFVRNSTWLT